MADAFLSVRDLSKAFSKQDKFVVSNLTFHVEKGEFFTLVGPSGCGKSTSINCLAGLEMPDTGEILLNGAVIFSAKQKIFLPPEKRNFGMVFQSYALWPHMSVGDNVSYPLRLRHKSHSEINQKVTKILNLVHLSGYEHRSISQLSGGEQQRVALARALVYEPRLLLLDEPLSNLDAKMREHMKLELKSIQRRLGITTIFVTHDQVEALQLSNRIAVLNQGVIQQIGTPTDIYKNPQNRFVADFIGLNNFLEGKMVDTQRDDPDSVLVETQFGQLKCLYSEPHGKGESVLVLIRPEDISISDSTDTPNADGTIEGKIVSSSFRGATIQLEVYASGKIMKVQANSTQSFSEGASVLLSLDKSATFRIFKL